MLLGLNSKKIMVCCSASNCSNSTAAGFRLFKFPSDNARKAIWLQNCRPDSTWKPTANSRLCEVHFEGNQWEGKRADGWVKLKQTAIPTLFNVPNPPARLSTERKSTLKIWCDAMESDKLCRLCASVANLLVPIFEEEGSRQKLAMKIKKYLPIKVSQDDCLPDRVCFTCLSTLNAWHKLMEKCVSSDKKLRNIFDAQVKQETIMANEEKSVENTTVCDKNEDTNAVKQAVREKTNGNAEVICNSTRYKKASSVPSMFSMQKSDDPKTTPSVPVPGEVSSSTLLRIEKVVSHLENPVSNDDCTNNNRNNKKVVTVTKFPVGVNIHGKIVTISRSNQCVKLLPKSGDKCKLFVVCRSKNIDPTQNQSAASQSFKCDICQTVLSSHLELAAHRMASHTNVPRCKFCNKVCSDDDTLAAHEHLHQKDIVHCQVCRKSVSSFRALKIHFKTHADTGLRLCNFCNAVFADESELKDHEDTHQKGRPEKPYLCETCGKTFRFRASIRQHHNTHLDDSVMRKFKCELCGTVYRSKNILKRHLAMHNSDGVKNYVCEICGKCFLRMQSLTDHSKVHSNMRPYKCTLCGIGFKWNKNLNNHKRVHAAADVKKRYRDEYKKRHRVKCRICGQLLASLWNLSLHMKNHDVSFIANSSVCHICGKTLCSTQAMARHLSMHAGMKLFHCSLCSKDFTTKYSLDNHIRSHTGEKPFACDVCGKHFSSKVNLHTHRVIHSDKRPFQCTYCPKSFRRRPHLVLHIRTHTGEKPYVCETCSRGFSQKNDMLKHRLTHSKERLFVCECGQSFRQKQDLQKHKKKHLDQQIPCM